MKTEEDTSKLLSEAKSRMIDDMAARGIGAIIWNIPNAGFHYIPEIVIGDVNGDPQSVRVTGLYHFHDDLYAIEEEVAGLETEEFYNPQTEVAPVTVTLSEDKARERIGNPANKKGFTTAGTLEEWVAIADCYFEALAEG